MKKDEIINEKMIQLKIWKKLRGQEQPFFFIKKLKNLNNILFTRS
jgi:hypothetical protein